MLSLPRGALLLAIVLLHLATLLSLQPRLVPPPEATSRRSELVFVLPPALPASPSPAARLAAPPAPNVGRAPRDRSPPPPASSDSAAADRSAALPPSTRSPQPITPPAGPSESDPFAAPAPATDTLLAQSRSAAAGIDRALRQERRETLALREPELARKFGAAYIDRSHRISETVLPNGDVIMKVQSPLGTYCWRKWGNSFQGGRDPFRDTGKQFAVQCPK